MKNHKLDCPCCFARNSLGLTYQAPKTTCYQEIIENLSKTSEDIVKVVNECHPFIFAKKDYDETVDPEEYHGEIDIPFPVISIEVIGEPISSPRMGDSDKVWISSIIVHEYAPKSYDFVLYFQRDIDGGIEKGLLPIRKESLAYPSINGLVNNYMQRLSKEKIGVTGRGQKVKYKTNGEKKYFKPKNITYVSSKKYISSVNEKSERHIEWTHRWEVRGTWRKIKGIGKDRTGNYCIQGYTWVIPFVKGPENSPLIKKSRVVTEETI